MRRRESSTAVAYFGQQPCCPDGAAAGQAGENGGIVVGGELPTDVVGQLCDLGDEVGQGGYQRIGDRDVGGPVGASEPARPRAQPCMQNGGVRAACVADRGQPGAQALGCEPVGAVLA